MHQACLSLLEKVRLIICLNEKAKCFIFDLADAASGSYGSSSRMLFEAASPLSSHVVNLMFHLLMSQEPCGSRASAIHLWWVSWFPLIPHHFVWPITWVWGWQSHGKIVLVESFFLLLGHISFLVKGTFKSLRLSLSS